MENQHGIEFQCCLSCGHMEKWRKFIYFYFKWIKSGFWNAEKTEMWSDLKFYVRDFFLAFANYACAIYSKNVANFLQNNQYKASFKQWDFFFAQPMWELFSEENFLSRSSASFPTFSRAVGHVNLKIVIISIYIYTLSKFWTKYFLDADSSKSRKCTITARWSDFNSK